MSDYPSARTARPGDFVSARSSFKKRGLAAPKWHVARWLDDGRLWVHRDGCGYKAIEPYLYIVAYRPMDLGDEEPRVCTLAGGAGGKQG